MSVHESVSDKVIDNRCNNNSGLLEGTLRWWARNTLYSSFMQHDATRIVKTTHATQPQFSFRRIHGESSLIILS